MWHALRPVFLEEEEDETTSFGVHDSSANGHSHLPTNSDRVSSSSSPARRKRCSRRGAALALALLVATVVVGVLLLSRKEVEGRASWHIPEESILEKGDQEVRGEDEVPTPDPREPFDATQDPTTLAPVSAPRAAAPSTGPAGGGVSSSNRTLLGLTELGEKLSASLPESCPRWSASFVDRYREQCTYWLNALSHWETKADTSIGGSVYTCREERKCNGLGDRLAGLQSVLTYAMVNSRAFRIKWTGLNRLMKPCALTSVAARWHVETSPLTGCRVEKSHTCAKEMNPHCYLRSSSREFENINIACLPPTTCKSLLKEYSPDGAVNAVQMLGCPLRALMEPSEKFMTGRKIPFKEGFMNATDRTLEEIEGIFKKYYVIGVHFRLGDYLAFRHASSFPPDIDPRLLENAKFLQPFRCAQTIQSYMEKRGLSSAPHYRATMAGGDELAAENVVDDEYKVDGRPVRWFLASDSKHLRAMAQQAYGNKLLLIETLPEHLSLNRDTPDVLSDTLAEWYVLGLSDKLVTNRLGQRGLFYGRHSAFPKTSWVYHLKSLMYDARTCWEREVELDGTWSHLPDCKKSPLFHTAGKDKFIRRPQPHLEELERLSGNKTVFPRSWVVNGRAHIVTSTELIDEDNEVDEEDPDVTEEEEQDVKEEATDPE